MTSLTRDAAVTIVARLRGAAWLVGLGLMLWQGGGGSTLLYRLGVALLWAVQGMWFADWLRNRNEP